MALIFVQSELDDVLQFRQDYTMDDDNRDRREMECYRLSMIYLSVVLCSRDNLSSLCLLMNMLRLYETFLTSP